MTRCAAVLFLFVFGIVPVRGLPVQARFQFCLDLGVVGRGAG